MDDFKTSAAQRRAVSKYNKNIGRINLRLSKEKKEIIESHAREKGESVNGFVNRAIDETIERDNRQ